MDARRRRWLQEESLTWQADGVVRPDQREAILARYPEEALRPSLAMRTFYTLGGVLLGASVFALWRFMDLQGWIDMDDEPFAWGFFAAFAAVWFLVSAFFFHARRDEELGLVFALAGLLPATALVGPDPGPDAAVLLAPIAALAVFLWRLRDDIVPMAALLAFSGSLPAAFEQFLDDETGTTVWLIVAVLVLAGLLWHTRRHRHDWHHVGLGIATVAAAVAWTVFTGEVTIDATDFDGDMEVFVGLGLGVLIAVGIAVRERVPVFVGGLALTVDTVVFAFDVGGVEWGLATLIVLSGGLTGMATWLRRRQKPAAASPRP